MWTDPTPVELAEGRLGPFMRDSKAMGQLELTRPKFITRVEYARRYLRLTAACEKVREMIGAPTIPL